MPLSEDQITEIANDDSWLPPELTPAQRRILGEDLQRVLGGENPVETPETAFTNTQHTGGTLTHETLATAIEELEQHAHTAAVGTALIEELRAAQILNEQLGNRAETEAFDPNRLVGETLILNTRKITPMIPCPSWVIDEQLEFERTNTDPRIGMKLGWTNHMEPDTPEGVEALLMAIPDYGTINITMPYGRADRYGSRDRTVSCAHVKKWGLHWFKDFTVRSLVTVEREHIYDPVKRVPYPARRIRITGFVLNSRRFILGNTDGITNQEHVMLRNLERAREQHNKKMIAAAQAILDKHQARVKAQRNRATKTLDQALDIVRSWPEVFNVQMLPGIVGGQYYSGNRYENVGGPSILISFLPVMHHHTDNDWEISVTAPVHLLLTPNGQVVGATEPLITLHPHITAGGNCLGNADYLMQELVDSANILGILEVMRQLRRSLNRHSLLNAGWQQPAWAWWDYFIVHENTHPLAAAHLAGYDRNNALIQDSESGEIDTLENLFNKNRSGNLPKATLAEIVRAGRADRWVPTDGSLEDYSPDTIPPVNTTRQFEPGNFYEQDDFDEDHDEDHDDYRYIVCCDDNIPEDDTYYCDACDTRFCSDHIDEHQQEQHGWVRTWCCEEYTPPERTIPCEHETCQQTAEDEGFEPFFHTGGGCIRRHNATTHDSGEAMCRTCSQWHQTNVGIIRTCGMCVAYGGYNATIANEMPYCSENCWQSHIQRSHNHFLFLLQLLGFQQDAQGWRVNDGTDGRPQLLRWGLALYPFIPMEVLTNPTR